MATSNGQYVLDDFVAELKAMGFDGFQDSDLQTYVNRGYFAVARKNRWSWEETTDQFTLNAGDTNVQLWPNGTELPYFKSLDKLFLITAGQQRRITPNDEDDFYENWLSRDLTAASSRGNPETYFIHGGRLYILPPPQATRTFEAHFHRRVAPLTDANKYPAASPTDVPLTPPDLDEAILIAAKIRCHKRAQELTLATQERVDLEEFYDDMKDEEAEIMDELPDRVRPDNTWL